MAEHLGGDEATVRAVWYPAETVLAVPYDTPITVGAGRHVNALRLWAARAPSPLDLSALSRGDVVGATAARAQARGHFARALSDDSTPGGKKLRLRQEFLLHLAVAAGPGPPPL